MPRTLEQRWLVLWQRVGAQGKPGEVYNDLVARYSAEDGPRRAYHTLEGHIRYCLNAFEMVRGFANNPNAVELAIWCHDADRDSVEESARFAREVVREMGLPDGFGQLVADLVMATKHDVIPSNPDACLLVSIDLLILGLHESEFDEYERQIREEWKEVPMELFAAERSRILKRFLDRDLRACIYPTPFFRVKYEGQARRNLSRSVEQLAKWL